MQQTTNKVSQERNFSVRRASTADMLVRHRFERIKPLQHARSMAKFIVGRTVND